jgi:thiol-disulfide isomerase/thioredoxin
MKITKSFFVFVISLLFLSNCKNVSDHSGPTTSKSITLQLRGKDYDQISLKAAIPGPNHSDKILFFSGESLAPYKWRFSVPDSVIDLADYFAIVTRPFDFKTNTYYSAKFRNPSLNDNILYNYVFDKENPNLEASLIQTIKTQGKPGDGNYFIVNDTFLTDGISRVEDVFEAHFINGKETELGLNMKFPRFRFIDNDHYKSSFAQKDSIIKKHPGSKYLMNQFFYLFKQLEIEDARTLFFNFTVENKTSSFGKQISDYLYLYSTPFKNTVLINSNSELPEPIILDSSKINLLVFSASWCSPCHKLIPVLKEIYKDLDPDLKLVYVSLDELNYIQAWKKLIHDNNIPWRSLSAYGHIKEIESRYDAASLPHMLLVFPDKTVTKVDIRNEEEKDKIYHLAKRTR